MIEKKTINYALRPSIRCLVENREMKEDIERMESESFVSMKQFEIDFIDTIHPDFMPECCEFITNCIRSIRIIQ